MAEDVSGAGSDLVPASAGPTLPTLRLPVVEAARGYAAASRAASTRRQYEAAWDDFSAWCIAEDQEALPAHPVVVAAFLSAEAARGLSPSVIQVKLSAIGWVHRRAGKQNPLRADEGALIAEIMAGIRRSHGKPPKRKAAADADICRDILYHIRGNALRNVRDRALIAFGMASCMRRSELVALNCTDVVRVPEGLRVTIARSKGDQEGRGVEIAVPDEVAAELDAIAAELSALDARERCYRPEDMTVAGAVVTLAGDGTVRVERGYVRPGDEPAPEPVVAGEDGGGEGEGEGDVTAEGDATAPSGTPLPSPAPAEAEDPSPHLSAALEGELEAHRTAGLQAELVNQPRLAFRVLLHGLATDAFYARYGETVARFTAYPPSLGAACPTIADSPARAVLTEAEVAWRARLPAHHAELWTWLAAPASWATALVNGDTSGLDDDPDDAAACRAWLAEAAEEGWRVVDVARDADGNAEDPWFSSSAGFHGSPYSGADLLNYVRERPARG